MKMHHISLAASVMAMDYSALGDDIRACEAAGVDIFHWDIMDGHFVPNMTFGADVVRSLRPVTQKPFDTHLMVSDPERWIGDFADAGSDAITFHAELSINHIYLANKIRNHGIRAGLAFNPDTPLNHVSREVFEHFDLVLVMTVQPGFGGQTFIDQSDKIRQLVEWRTDDNHFDISVDGGINLETAPIAIQAGADILVSGSALSKAASQSAFIQTIKQGAQA